MKQETIRRVDSWAGKPACWALTAVRRIGDLASGRTDRVQARPRKIRVLKLTEQGAAVLAHAAVQRAAAMVGRENTYFCVFEENREIIEILDLVPPSNLLLVRTGSLVACLMDLVKAVLRARALGVDATVDLEFYARASAVIAYLMGAARRVGLHRFTGEAPYRGDLMTRRVQYNPYIHTAAAYQVLVEALTRDPDELPLAKVPVPPVPAPPRFVATDADTARVRQMLADGLGEKPRTPIIVLNPNSGDLLRVRKWPAERFLEIGRRLLAAYPDCALVVIGTPAERESAEAFCRALGSPNAVSLAGKTSLRDLVVLFTLCDVLVTGDSGPAHFASLTDIEVVVLFGPETPALFGPLGEHIRVVRGDLACSPCLNVFNHRVSPCADNVCIHSICVDEVYAEVIKCIEIRSGRRQS